MVPLKTHASLHFSYFAHDTIIKFGYNFMHQNLNLAACQNSQRRRVNERVNERLTVDHF